MGEAKITVEGRSGEKEREREREKKITRREMKLLFTQFTLRRSKRLASHP